MGNNCVGPSIGRSGFLQSVTAAVWRTRPPEHTLPPPNTTTTQTPSKQKNNNNAGHNKPENDHVKSHSVQSTPPDTAKMSGQETAIPVETVKVSGQETVKTVKPVDTVKVSGQETVKAVETVKVPGQETVKVSGKEKVNVSGKETVNVSGKETVKVSGKEVVKAVEPVKVSGQETVKVSGKETVKVSGQETVKVPGKETVKVSGKEVVKAFEPVKVSGQETVKAVKVVENVKLPEEKPKPASNYKRVQSIGLKNSVLQRKTDNLKETYSMGKKLGQGQFGTTFLCTQKETGKEFACKSIAKRKLTTKEDVEDVRREIQIMHHLSGHVNVISIVGAYEDAVAVHVVMELCAGGELFDRIIQRGHYTEKKAAELTRIIVGVVEACHSLGVMHRDLKPENFLFVSEQEEAPLKTIDFGLSTFFKPGEMFTDMVGSPYYVAPEVLRKFYSQECDIWSAGVIIYILLSGVPPFWDETEQGIFEHILKGDLDFASEPWPSISESAKDLLRKMLVRDPKRRLTAPEVLSHPWVQANGVASDKPIDSAVLSRLKQFSAMNKIKKIAIRVIAESLSEEEIAGLKQMFKMIDVDGSGQITLEELKKGLEKAGSNLKDSEIARLMEAADIDNSGTIDYGEFVAAMLHINKCHKEDHMYAAFSYFDKDGSGYITADELQLAFDKFGLGDVHLDEVMSDIDKDNDGRIDYSEFVAMMKEGDFGKNMSLRLR